MAGNRSAAAFAIPAATALLLWPALWNGYPIVFADTGTYLSQAIHWYAGWDRPVFYSLFMLPLHATLTLWPVIVAQAVLACVVLRLVCRVLAPDLSEWAFIAGVGALSACTWLPWIVSELMPDVFTPLLVLVLCLLACVPQRLSGGERFTLVGLATFMIASQQSSVPLACVLLGTLGCLVPIYDRTRSRPLVRPGPDPILATFGLLDGDATFSHYHGPPISPRHGPACTDHLSRQGRGIGGPDKPDHDNEATAGNRLQYAAEARSRLSIMAGEEGSDIGPKSHYDNHSSRPRHWWLLIVLPPALAVLVLCCANLAAHGRFAISPFGNIFPLARVIYDGPGMATLRRDCPTAHWRLCPFLDSFPATSDDFLWAPDSPLKQAGGAKAISLDASEILAATLRADPGGEATAALSNTREQLTHFDSGDGLNPWPDQVSPWIKLDFPARERSAYEAARQQAGTLSVPPALAQIHAIVAVIGVLACIALLPVAIARRMACWGFLLAALLALPVSAAITGVLSGPHERYQSRIMWLPAFVAVVSLASFRQRGPTLLLPLGDIPAQTSPVQQNPCFCRIEPDR